MRVIKKINNNFAMCLDDNDNELIAYGKGIGFPEIPYELEDLSNIDQTFYGVSAMYMNLVQEIPEEIFTISSKIVDFAKLTIDKELNPNVVFTLADHISFAIKRKQEGIYFKSSFLHEIQHLYDQELEVGQKGIELIEETLGISLSKEEAGSIALHFINAEKTQPNRSKEISEDEVIEAITQIIEQDFMITINKEGFNYSRFISHLTYLLKRRENDVSISSDNGLLFKTIKEEFSQAYQCATHIKEYLINNLAWDISDEELLYLILHINRMCIREDCHQS